MAEADQVLEHLVDHTRANRERQIEKAESREGTLGLSLEHTTGADEAAQPAAPGEAELAPAVTNAARELWHTRNLQAQVDLERSALNLGVQRGELTRADRVAEAQFHNAQSFAQKLMQLPARLAPLLNANNPREAENILRIELTRLIDAVGRDLSATKNPADH